MRSVVFGNEFFDQWLHQKSSEILSKAEKEKFTSEDMLILSLKAQVNHFHHMDIEFRDEFGSIRKQFAEVDRQFALVAQRFEQVDKRFEQVDKRFEQVDWRFEQVDRRLDQMDKRIDRMTSVNMWGFGILITMMSGMFYKLLLL